MTRRTLIAALLLFAAPAWAQVVRIQVTSRADVPAGKAFGTAGPYEKPAGTLHFAVDPSRAANRKGRAAARDADSSPPHPPVSSAAPLAALAPTGKPCG